MPTAFSINFDYRCPFARNANEHVLTALESGADYDVSFKGFSLTQMHIEDGQPSAWEDPNRHDELVAVAAGIAVRERMPALFYAAHRSLFAKRHDDGEDLRDEFQIRDALTRAGVDADVVFKELADGWPFQTLRAEHEEAVNQHAAFGVPTFVQVKEAVFVRVMTRPEGDPDRARSTIGQILALLEGHPEINEYKHTTVNF